MLSLIAAVLIVLWIIGLLAHVTTGFIHLLLIAAIVLFIWHAITGRRHTV